MKSKSMLVFSALLAGASLVNAANTNVVYNITGATAFRAAAQNGIINLLGGPGVVEYAFSGATPVASATRSIFKGPAVVTNVPNPGDTQTIIVRCSWSGSTAGLAVLDSQATTVQFPLTTVTMTTAGNYLGATPAPTASFFENTNARFSFSDVDKALSTVPNSGIQGDGVGVVPFMFVAGESAPASITNMTDQIHAALWSQGTVPASFITGNPAQAGFTIFATGRNNGSGTRAAVLAETQYGAFTPVLQFNSGTSGDRLTGALTGAPFIFPAVVGPPAIAVGNNGFSNNIFVRDLLTRSSDPTALGGQYAFVSYLTISDAVAATGYDQATGLITLPSEGAKPMTYNGVRYSEQNVNNGSYSLWSFQQFYRAAVSTPAEDQFASDLIAAIQPVLTADTGLPVTNLNVQRAGGDGGPIAPN
jgi:hypothetical protein